MPPSVRVDGGDRALLPLSSDLCPAHARDFTVRAVAEAKSNGYQAQPLGKSLDPGPNPKPNLDTSPIYDLDLDLDPDLKVT